MKFIYGLWLDGGKLFILGDYRFSSLIFRYYLLKWLSVYILNYRYKCYFNNFIFYVGECFWYDIGIFY